MSCVLFFGIAFSLSFVYAICCLIVAILIAYVSRCLCSSSSMMVFNMVAHCVCGVCVISLICCCMLLARMDGSYACLQEWSYQRCSYAVERVQRKHRYSRYGKGSSKIETVW